MHIPQHAYFSFASRNATQDSENELFYLPTVPERDPEVETEFEGGDVGSGAISDGVTPGSAQQQKQKQKHKASSATAASKAKRKSSGAKGKSKGKVCRCRFHHLLLMLQSLLLTATSCTKDSLDNMSVRNVLRVRYNAGKWWQTIENAVDKSKTRARPQGARSTGRSSGGS